jgi:hypothetical protein
MAWTLLWKKLETRFRKLFGKCNIKNTIVESKEGKTLKK